MSAFAELRDFARDTIPALLLEAGGEMDKQEMHTRIERLFAAARPWPDELDGIQKSGCSVARNATAWAIASLVKDGALASSAGRSTIRLAHAPNETRPTARDQADVRPSHRTRIKLRAVERARNCRGRARREGVPFDEAIIRNAPDDIERQDFRCAATGIPFDLDTIGEGAGASHFAPSPDRIVPAGGYVPGNVRWVLWMVNRAKGRMTEEQFLMMCRAIASRN